MYRVVDAERGLFATAKLLVSLSLPSPVLALWCDRRAMNDTEDLRDPGAGLTQTTVSSRSSVIAS